MTVLWGVAITAALILGPLAIIFLTARRTPKMTGDSEGYYRMYKGYRRVKGVWL